MIGSMVNVVNKLTHATSISISMSSTIGWFEPNKISTNMSAELAESLSKSCEVVKAIEEKELWGTGGGRGSRPNQQCRGRR